MNKKNLEQENKEKLIKFFSPPGEPWIYHTALKENGPEWKKVHENALDYYSGSSYKDPVLKSWEETIRILTNAAKQERQKEIELLGDFISAKDKAEWLNLSWTKNKGSLLYNYKKLITAINNFLGNKEFFEFAKEISALKASKKTQKKAEEVFSLIKYFAKEIEEETKSLLFSDDRGGIFTTAGLRNLLTNNTEAQIIKEIEDELSKGFLTGLLKGKDKLKNTLNNHNIINRDIIKTINFLSKSNNFLEILKNYSIQVPGVNFLREEVRSGNISKLLAQGNFSNSDLNKVIKSINTEFLVKIERTSGLVSKTVEDVGVEIFTKSIAMQNGELGLVKNLKNETYSLDSIAIITENPNMLKKVEKFIIESKAENKIEAREEYQKLEKELKDLADKALKVPKGYTIINFNTKAYIKDDKFSAGGERKIQDINFMLSEVTDPKAFTNRLAQFGVGFLFNKKKMGEDKEIVQVLGRLLIYIGGFLFEGFKGVSSDLHSGVNMLYLNHYLIPFSFVLFSLANSLEIIKDDLVVGDIKSRSRSPGKKGKAKSVQVFDQNTTAHLNLRIGKTLMGPGRRQALLDKKYSENDFRYYFPAWKKQSEEALNAITIQASFLREFQKRMDALLK